ncbi:DUF3828 domain-containing protein [Massilia violaceinigra]|uniref:DUF3828 domain-containing protein n=1 Tax=Massilia violaceinigra TaxID=2045208 RepID=A0ABY4AH80_9BURK|nr:DUF3828 domain-containing protein [Massilia violaceinigra]UOD33279.1 DUF3828 domain-containing protein [Massilia violaceinigra]
MNSEDGLDADYFIQAQDYHDDWEKNISVAKSRISGNAATVRVTPGAGKESIQRLELTLKKKRASGKSAEFDNHRKRRRRIGHCTC